MVIVAEKETNRKQRQKYHFLHIFGRIIIVWHVDSHVCQADLFAFLIFTHSFNSSVSISPALPYAWAMESGGIASVDGLSIWHIFEMEMLVIVLNFCLRDFQDHSTLHSICVALVLRVATYRCWLSLSLTRFMHIWYCVLLCLSLIHAWLMKLKTYRRAKNNNNARDTISYGSFCSFRMPNWCSAGLPRPIDSLLCGSLRVLMCVMRCRLSHQCYNFSATKNCLVFGVVVRSIFESIFESRE